MIFEHRLSIRSALNNDSQKPFMEIILTPWLCFAVITVNGQVKTVPGVSLASAQTNALAYLLRKTAS